MGKSGCWTKNLAGSRPPFQDPCHPVAACFGLSFRLTLVSSIFNKTDLKAHPRTPPPKEEKTSGVSTRLPSEPNPKQEPTPNRPKLANTSRSLESPRLEMSQYLSCAFSSTSAHPEMGSPTGPRVEVVSMSCHLSCHIIPCVLESDWQIKLAFVTACVTFFATSCPVTLVEKGTLLGPLFEFTDLCNP